MAALTESERAYLRLLLDDPEQQGSSTKLSDPELDAIWDHSGGDLNRAAAEGWSVIASRHADMIDISESGTQRFLSQLYRNARRQAELFEWVRERMSRTDSNVGTGIVGRSVKIADDRDVSPGASIPEEE